VYTFRPKKEFERVREYDEISFQTCSGAKLNFDFLILVLRSVKTKEDFSVDT